MRKHTQPFTRKEIQLPTALVAEVNLRLYDPVFNQARYGAWSRYIEALIRKDLARKRLHKPETSQ